jgi:hypothetical protein
MRLIIEIQRFGRNVRIEIETYMGVSVIGEAEAVDEFVEALRASGVPVNEAGPSRTPD